MEAVCLQRDYRATLMAAQVLKELSAKTPEEQAKYRLNARTLGGSSEVDCAC